MPTLDTCASLGTFARTKDDRQRKVKHMGGLAKWQTLTHHRGVTRYDVTQEILGQTFKQGWAYKEGRSRVVCTEKGGTSAPLKDFPDPRSHSLETCASPDSSTIHFNVAYVS